MSMALLIRGRAKVTTSSATGQRTSRATTMAATTSASDRRSRTRTTVERLAQHVHIQSPGKREHRPRRPEQLLQLLTEGLARENPTKTSRRRHRMACEALRGTKGIQSSIFDFGNIQN